MISTLWSILKVVIIIMATNIKLNKSNMYVGTVLPPKISYFLKMIVNWSWQLDEVSFVLAMKLIQLGFEIILAPGIARNKKFSEFDKLALGPTFNSIPRQLQTKLLSSGSASTLQCDINVRRSDRHVVKTLCSYQKTLTFPNNAAAHI
ncbi:hypothetical protein EGR_06243 [Echinococcus granulosus]|uniref:Uncharacterized protein n=1 Tax=Echinococcus granulosus TaxID=6210 RepID=W6ULD7_ECHGR|nr:hypothetical protein EGR_06243 [Echinococcus granulosus]EUB58927.1 hypothetical protein EGR_06243 [Echinococcus granulosus]